MAWEYTRDESKGFSVLPVGDYRVRIEKAERATSSKGNDMLVLQLEVSGKRSKLFHRITFLPDRPEITNRNLTKFFDSFKDIADGDMDESHYVGKVGACHVKHGEWNGNQTAEVDYFIAAGKQDALPPWVEPEGGSKEMLGASSAPVPSDDLPPF